MKRRFIGIALVCSLFFPLLAMAQEGLDEEVRAVGEAEIIDQNFARARQEAVAQAMRASIVQVAEAYFDPVTYVRIQDIIEGRLEGIARRLVKDYRLLEETRVDDRFRVELSAVLWRSQLHKALIDWGILYDRAKRPRILVVAIDGDPSVDWMSQLKFRFRDLGFPIVQTQEEADILVRGVVGPADKHALPASFEVEMRNPSRKFAQRTIQLDQKWSEAKRAGFWATAILGRALPTWVQAVGGGRVYEIEVSGFRNNLSLKELRNILNSREWGFSEGRDALYAPGVVVFQTVFDGEVGKLVNTLGRMKLGGEPLSVVGVKDRKVQVQIGRP